MGFVGFPGHAGRYVSGLCVAGAPWTGPARLDVFVGLALAAAGFGGFFTALAGRVRELYVQAGTAQEPGGGPE